MPAKIKPLSTCHRVTLLLIGLFECGIFGGLVFGWPQLVLVLKHEGIYGNLCPDNTATGNVDDSSQLLTGQSVSGCNSSLINFGTTCASSPAHKQDEGEQAKRWRLWKEDKCDKYEIQETQSNEKEVNMHAIIIYVISLGFI